MMFESRDTRNSSSLGLMLSEVGSWLGTAPLIICHTSHITCSPLSQIEQYSGIIILATNRQQDMDEAMHRR